MLLKNLLKGVKVLDIKGSLDIDILCLSQKAEQVKKGSLFFCFNGVNFDGHNFVNKAEKKGAAALVVEHFVDSALPQILVKKTRNIMPKVCNNFFEGVVKKLKFIGVTGTNGKTTTTSIIYNILNASGKKAGLIGTNGVKYKNKFISQNLTTPDTVDLFYLLNKMQKSGVEYVVMEVSAHAIALNKVKGIKFEIGIFSNLTQDHLDYFKTMNNYARTKLKFLTKNYCKQVVLNVDDSYGCIFKKLVKTKLITYALNNPATCFAIDVQNFANHTTFVANVLDEVMFVTINLPCIFNVYNTLSAIIACKVLGIESKYILNAIKTMPEVEGRMNCYALHNNATAIIDFAHTPDGLEKVLQNLSSIKTNGSIITVFGCGGNRDRLKRSKMGEIASKYSNKIIVTNDNPRNESPKQIADDIVLGLKTNNYEIILDRKQAIIKAINFAKCGDIILIAGKGAEPYQEIGGVKYKYNDKDVILNYIKK